ncbi:MAG: hypothetical protein IJE25_06030 [Clostridia bacterium]|nr:hypothetical protein [Clostridia bacterium]
MRSLSLSDDKLYCLASEYCTDVLRASQVIPVNAELMNSIDPNKLPILDGVERKEDMSNMEYLYEAVWAKKWDYDVLLKLCNAVFVDRGTAVTGGVANADITDVLGFGVTTNSFASCSLGILYSSGVEILTKQFLTAEAKSEAEAKGLGDCIAGDYLITYPETNSELTALANTLNRFFTKGATQGVALGDRFELRSSFASGDLLFGSVICLGELEDESYQGLRVGEGFGIVPVPVYKVGNEYNTVVHGGANILAIARATDRFEQVSAFLDYQSRNSSNILELYCEIMCSQIIDQAENDYNALMFRYISSRIGGSLDTTYDYLLEGLFNSDVIAGDNPVLEWEKYLIEKKYQITDMDTVYRNKIAGRSEYLKLVIETWNRLR